MMSQPSWKLVGIGLASVGLSAGALAVASAALEPAAQDKPPELPPPHAVAAEERTGPSPVERRLDDLEAKVDRIAAMLADRPATVPAPPASIRSALDARGLREIEAQLINAHQDYQRALALSNRTGGTKQDVEDCVKHVRFLLARLLEMKDEAEDAEKRFNAFSEDIGWRRRDLDAAESRLEEASRGGEASPVRVARFRSEVESARRFVEALTREEFALGQTLRPVFLRGPRVERLISWTREHFPGVELTIDDAPKDAAN